MGIGSFSEKPTSLEEMEEKIEELLPDLEEIPKPDEIE